MSYLSVVEMAASESLVNRITAAAAGEGDNNPVAWARTYVWSVVSSPGWTDSWESGKAGATADDNPDTGARPSVITDGMILSAVQAVRTAQSA